jgi:hypothetical protein
MSSNHYLTSDDLRMLNGVLAEAGMHDDFEDAARRDVRSQAARYLISRFQEGARSAGALKRELARKVAARPVERQILTGSAFVSYQYGKRIEADRTWTIIHVFTGKAARRDGWTMRGLTREGAIRLLRTMNEAPAGA